jgi:NitT/TauT family transport system substrate-binding protein
MKEKIVFVLMVLALVLSACAPAIQPPTAVSPTQKPADTIVPPTATTAAPVKVNVCYSSTSAGTAPLWYAQDNGLFAKYGLEVTTTLISSGSDAVAALISGDVKFCLVAGAGVVNAVAAGKDPVLIAGLHNKFIGGFYTTPDIKTPEDLRGKTLAISKPGSSSTVGTLLVLKAFGLVADQDVTLVSVGNDSERLAAMKAGQVSGAVLSPPSSLEAERDGYNKMFDLTTSDIPYQYNGIATTRSFIASDRGTVTAFMKAIIEAIALVKADPDGTKAILAKYLELDPVADASILDGSYNAFVTLGLESIPYPTLPGIQTIIDTSIAANPAVASVTPEQVVDISIVKELEDSGFITSVQP